MKRIGLSLLVQVILAAIITFLSIFLAEQQLKFHEVSHNGIIVGIAVLLFFVVEGYATKMFFMKKIMKICSPEQQKNYSLLWINIAIALLHQRVYYVRVRRAGGLIPRSSGNDHIVRRRGSGRWSMEGIEEFACEVC